MKAATRNGMTADLSDAADYVRQAQAGLEGDDTAALAKSVADAIDALQAIQRRLAASK